MNSEEKSKEILDIEAKANIRAENLRKAFIARSEKEIEESKIKMTTSNEAEK